MADSYEIGLVGAGIMGSAMARRWLEGGHHVRVWNRTPEKAERLADAGARVAETPMEAAEGCDWFVTMVTDGGAVRKVLERGDGLLEQFERDAVWMQMSTVGADDIDEFVDRAAAQDVEMVDAPVLGTKEPAEQGTLTVLGGANRELRESVEEVVEPVADEVRWVGEPGEATRVKLVCNNWVVGLLGVLSETMAVAEGLGVDPAEFLGAIEGGALDAGYAHIKGGLMQDGEYPASFPLRHALKDANLIAEAAREADLELSVLDGVVDLLERGVQAGHGDEDMAAAFEMARRRLS